LVATGAFVAIGAAPDTLVATDGVAPETLVATGALAPETLVTTGALAPETLVATESEAGAFAFVELLEAVSGVGGGRSSVPSQLLVAKRLPMSIILAII
jgi:hypothetical protein